MVTLRTMAVTFPCLNREPRDATVSSSPFELHLNVMAAKGYSTVNCNHYPAQLWHLGISQSCHTIASSCYSITVLFDATRSSHAICSHRCHLHESKTGGETRQKLVAEGESVPIKELAS